MRKFDRNLYPDIKLGIPKALSPYAASQGIELDPMLWDTLIDPKMGEELFGGPPGGSMAETTNEVGSAVEGLTVDVLRRMTKVLGLNLPRPTELATSDIERLKRVITEGQTLVPMTGDELKTLHSMKFYGLPVIYDEDLPRDILVEVRDQHGNSLGQITS